MAAPGWWNSYDRVDAIFRAAINTTIAAATIAAVSWIAAVASVAIVGIVLATTAVLVALFAWFRRDDLAGSRSNRP